MNRELKRTLRNTGRRSLSRRGWIRGSSSQRVQGHQSCRCNQDHGPHHSRAEAGYCNKLDLLRRAATKSKLPGEIKSFRTQVKISLDVPKLAMGLSGPHSYVHITNHYVDFEVEFYNGRMEWHEVKGWPSEVWQIKRRLCEALFPGTPYITVRV